MTFEFTREGQTYRVHTEVGEGLTEVVVEQAPAEPFSSFEPEEE